MDTARQQLAVGFLGTGYIADWHAKALQFVRGAKLIAVCDQDEMRVRAFAGRSRASRVYGSLSAMLTDVRLDVIHVLLPPELHAQAAGEIIDAGVNVLLEKPMATCEEACSSLIERARSKNITLGVSHNFLFAPVYEQLKTDLKSGRIGRIDEVVITWNKGVDQLQSGPFHLWMLREPLNVLLEVGPHSVAHMLDLVGPVEIISAHASNPFKLPGGMPFYRRWHINAGQAQIGVTLKFSFASGFTEHSIHVRGSLASATADFERNTYVLHQRTQFGLDFDRYRSTISHANALRSQARRTFSGIVLSKLRRSIGSAYGQSIANSVQSFYANLGRAIDGRLAPEFGREVVQACIEIGRRAAVQMTLPASRNGVAGANSDLVGQQARVRPEILVIGATGFIGQELARQLIGREIPIRVLVRSPSRLPPELKCGKVQVIVGDLCRETDIQLALEGIRVVYHLARPHVTTWEQYVTHDIEVTRRIAKACLAARVSRLIYTGTIDSYYAGARAGTITENTPLDPHIGWRNYYAQAKAASERILMSLYREQGLPVIIFRPGVVVGQGSSPLHWGVGMWSWDSVCQIWGKGRNPLPLVLVEDVAQALVAALNRPGIEGESFNLVANSPLSAMDYLRALEECTGSKFQAIQTAPWKFYAVDVVKWMVKRAIRHPDQRKPSYRDWESRTQRARYDCSKAKTLLDWNPTETPTELVHRGIQLPALERLA